jgi:hypothetical protein
VGTPCKFISVIIQAYDAIMVQCNFVIKVGFKGLEGETILRGIFVIFNGGFEKDGPVIVLICRGNPFVIAVHLPQCTM